ncbi:hypothetical protein OESDEN_17830 [Oesophagostomum dentatum]|uniref:Uncharacterized protein n=1 Tax=Oesophagostomum dentatum TaxID=61180 RepID=A0A0B1SF10_OESDE|nr:hypothetical protein OESDEN_17830 [Oesophagostomum dentatum]
MGTCILASLALLVEIRSGMKEQEDRTLYFITYLIAYNSIAISWEPNYMGAAELIPTEVRATNTALLNIVTRIANVFAARTVGKWKGKEDEWAIMVVVLTSCETKGISLEKIGQAGGEKSPRDAEEGKTGEGKGAEGKLDGIKIELKEASNDKKKSDDNEEDEKEKLLGGSGESAKKAGGSYEAVKKDQ